MSKSKDNKDEPLITREDEGKTKKKMSKFKVGLLIFVIAVGALIVAGISSAKGAIDAGNEYVAHLQAGECSEMYQKATDGFRKLGSEERWSEACTRVSDILQGDVDQRGADVQSKSGEDQESTVTYIIDGNDDTRYGVAISMVNRDGNWQMSNFDSDPLTEEDIQELSN